MPLELTPFQKRKLAASEDCDVAFSLGGRGSGKTRLNAMAALRHADRYAEHARILFVRRTQNALSELEDEIETILIEAYGRNGYTRNRNAHECRLNNGAVMRFECVDFLTPQTMARLVGQSVTLLIVEEAGQYGEVGVIDKLFSNLRGPEHVKVQCLMSANPGGVGASWLRRRTIDQAKPWEPYVEKETGLRCVYSISTFADNPKLDKGYEARLRASVASDPALAAAWLSGSFEKVSGAAFPVFDPKVHIIDPWPHIPRGWEARLGVDHGGMSPTVAELVLVARDNAIGADDRPYPKSSVVCIGEVSTAIPPSLSQGDGSAPADIAARIFAELLDPYGLKPFHLKVAAIDPSASVRAAGRNSYRVIDEYADAGLRCLRSGERQNRPARVQQVQTLLSNSTNGGAGLWVCRNCENLAAVLPTLMRSATRTSDIDNRGPKHSFDALSFALATRRGYVVRQTPGTGSNRRYSRKAREADEREGVFV